MAAEAERNLECSLPVPSVQELATQHPEIVPSRYIRDNVDDTIATVNPSSDDQILRAPLIDMAKLVNPDSQQQELQNLHSACKNWGLFQVRVYFSKHQLYVEFCIACYSSPVFESTV